MRRRCCGGTKAAAGGRRGYRFAGHEDRAAAELSDMPVIEECLPAAMSDAELAALVDAALARPARCVRAGGVMAWSRRAARAASTAPPRRRWFGSPRP